MGSYSWAMKLYTTIVILGMTMAIKDSGRFLTYVPPSPDVWTLLGACTGGRCSGTEEGNLMSPNYPSNYPDKADSTYILETTAGSTIRLVFQDFSLEGSGQCIHDYVKVLDSDDETKLAKLCGDERPKPLQSTGNKMTLEFYSDEDNNKKGFLANWKSVETPTTGVFESPNYPEQYDNHVKITQVLEAPKGERIEVTIEDFHTERCCDFLLVYLNGEKSPKRYSGKPQLPITHRSSRMKLQFTSDRSVTKGGFRARWRHVN